MTTMDTTTTTILLRSTDTTCHRILLECARKNSSTLSGILEFSDTLDASEEGVPVPAGDATIAEFIAWCDGHGTYDLSVDEYVASVKLADWLGADKYLRALLAGAYSLEDPRDSARLARIHACAAQLPNMAAMLAQLGVPTLVTEADAQALLNALAACTEADGSALSWCQIQQCDGRNVWSKTLAKGREETTARPLSIGLSHWAARERSRRAMASIKTSKAHGKAFGQWRFGCVGQEALQAANDEMWAVFDPRTHPLADDGASSPPLDIAAAEAAYARGASANLYVDHHNWKRHVLAHW